MKYLLIIPAAALMAVSCLSNNNRPAVVAETESGVILPDVTEVAGNPQQHSAQTSLDYEGTYNGTLPCADCEGIRTELTIDRQGNYTLKISYLGKGDGKTYETTGKYSWAEDGATIILRQNEQDGDDTGRMFFVAENKLIQLDRDGNTITGPNAEYYVLNKQ